MVENAPHFPRLFRGYGRLACLLGLGLPLLAGACAHAPGEKLATPQASVANARVSGDSSASEPRLFPPLEGSETLVAGEERDGSKRLISYGLRVLARPNGALELAHEYLPAARTVQSLELPSRLGGGFLFYVLSSSATLFFRAKTFTGELEPFARLEFEADQVQVGFDRLYVLARRPERLTALDAVTGAGLDLGSLPASPGYGKMAFIDAWFGAVQAPFRGTLVTFDAGASWRPLGLAVTNLEARDGALALTAADGAYLLDSSGALSRADAAPSDAENPVAQRLRLGATQASNLASAPERGALKLAVLRGFRDRDGSFVVAGGGALLRVRPEDGKVVDRDEHAYPGAGECTALPLGAGFGFSCSGGADETTLYTYEPGFALRLLRAFAGARYVASSGNGAVVVRGPCEGSAAAASNAYCLAGKDAKFREIRIEGEDRGVERVVALADGRAAVIVPPRLGAPGFLSLIDLQNHERRAALKLPSDGTPKNPLLENGLWLDGFRELPSGQLGGWVAGAEPFVGVRVALDGTVSASKPESSIDRVLLSGAHALIVGRTGRALESSDGGFEWSEVELPSEFDASREPRDEARLQGCSELGCAFAGFVRVGWKRGASAPHLAIAKLPEVTPLPEPGGSRWLLRCEATGEVSEPALALGAHARGPGRAEEASAPWASFLEAPAPSLAAGEVGYDTGSGESNSAELHAYAWGERGADWSRAGHALIRALDRFQVAGGVVQSAVTRSPWADANAAAEAFGFDLTGSPTNWRGVLESGQRSGAVVVSSRGLLDLILFEDGRSVTRVPNVARLGLGTLTSVTKLGDAWYASSFNENHAFTLSRIANNRIDRLAEYPDLVREQSSVGLVRGVHGDALGIWVMARGWYLFPVDPETGAVSAPFSASPAELAKMPPACAADADGFLLTGAPSLEPTLIFPELDQLVTRRVEAQLIWSARGLCTRALAADSEAMPKRSVNPPARGESKNASRVPLVISERRPEGRRYGFMCAP